jgi:ATP-dependent DNA ligase
VHLAAIQKRLRRQVVASHCGNQHSYVLPAAPTLRSAPPRGKQWLHEVKFDGWRIQLHKHGRSAAAFTKYGHAHSRHPKAEPTRPQSKPIQRQLK